MGRRCRKRRKQRGGALARHKTRLVDKTAEGANMFLSGPFPSFPSLAVKLAGQGLKGITDNMKYYRRCRW